MGRGGSEQTGTISERPQAMAATTIAARAHPERNEDSVLIDPGKGLAAVFDGIGGAAGGDAASQAARRAFDGALGGLPPIGDVRGRRDWLRQTMFDAAREVRAIRSSFGQGTTAAVALLLEGGVLVASIGDSRVYALSGRLEQLSRDDDRWPGDSIHDAARAACDEASSSSELDPLATRMFVSRNRLGAELGMVHDPPGIDGYPVERGALIIVTSDGVHDNLTRSEIERIALGDRGDPLAAAASLVAAARERADEEHMRAKDDDISCACLVA